VPSPLLTRCSVTHTRPAEHRATPLSSTFHRLLSRLLSGQAIIDSVHPRTLLIASARAGLAGLLLLGAACGSSTGSQVAQLGAGTTTTRSTLLSTPPTTNAQRMLAFSRCVREHGVPNYPDPDGTGHLPASGKQIARSSPKFPGAEDACIHLLQSAGGAQTQGDQQKLAFALKVARCVRRHGFPTNPDPTPSPSSQGSGTRFAGSGIDTKSPRFQTAETACEKETRKALGLP
jgi:hypothetical protein